MKADEFSQLKRAFMGGHTHANSNYVQKLLTNVASQDFTSSYPAVMVLEKFPMSISHEVDGAISKEEFIKLLNTKACLFDLFLKKPFNKLKNEHPIPRSKCWYCENPLVDNGRIVMADALAITVTEQDFITYSHFYDWEDYTISNLRYYDKQYLPHEFVKAILTLYKNKTTLKDVENEEINYMISKNMLNATFGMSVTNPVRDEIMYLDDDTYKTIKPVLQEAIETYNKNVRRFLFYPWGVWITAYARRNLFTGIEAVGDDFVYSDTDSIKYLNPEKHEKYFQQYNQEIMKKISLSAQFHRIDESEFSPLNKKGKAKTIGLWDYEGVYSKFKTLGAKRYLVEETESDGRTKLKATIAGANKKKAAEYLEKTGAPFENFDDNLRIPAVYSGRLTATYIDDEHDGYITDYLGETYHYHELSAIHMEPSEYCLTMSDEFINYLKGAKDLE